MSHKSTTTLVKWEEHVLLGINPIATFLPLKNYHLREANDLLGDVEEALPNPVPEDIQDMLDEAQKHVDNADTTVNTIYANNELLKAIELLEEVLEKL
ncbi:MAG: hypothetical protein U9N35_03570 [Euryarchaeota archaeon]|nr:hypothetical protein [Euryarchaeota archaeon]